MTFFCGSARTSMIVSERDPAELDLVEGVLGRGTVAAEQVEIYEESGSLLAVAEWLAKETVRQIE